MEAGTSYRHAYRLEILEIVCAVLILFLIFALFAELFNGYESSSALVVSLVTLVLVCVLCLSFGRDLRGRLKKLGPLELYEEKAKTLVQAVNRYRFKAKMGGEPGIPWVGERRFQYEELDRFVSLVEIESQVPSEGDLRASFFDVLFQVGTAAGAQGDWTRAAKRLELLVKLSRGQYEPASTFFNLGLSFLEWADLTLEDIAGEPARDELLDKAVTNLEKACAHDPHDHMARYWLAYALDERGDCGDAIATNAAALRIRPLYAPAKYNAAVSSAKMKRFRSAFRRLQSISLDDEEGKEALQLALEDTELESLRDHCEIGAEVTTYLERMTDSNSGDS